MLPSTHIGLDSLAGILSGLPAAPLLLVADPLALNASGLGPELARLLAGRSFTTFDRIESNPSLERAREVASLARSSGAGLVVSVGGGSAIDLAKLAALLAPLDPSRWNEPGSPKSPDPQPLTHIAIPTTSGSGSEATQFAVMYADGVKRSIDHPSLLPHAAVLDIRLHLAMPAPLAAVSGLDALCQAIESRWAVGATEGSIPLSHEAGDAVRASLVDSVTRATPRSREAMMHAAHRAGRAINITRTTAAHALSYPLSRTLGIPHGHAVALTIGAIAARNAETTEASCNDPRGPWHVRAAVAAACGMLGTVPGHFAEGVRRLMGDLGLARTLGEAGLERPRIDSVVSAVDPVRLSNNPRRLTREDLYAILAESL